MTKNRLRLRLRKKITFLLLFIVFSIIAYSLLPTRYTLVPAAYATIVGTKHDLSATGTGDIRAVSETAKCAFCHTPHSASTEGPLWNRTLSSETYTAPQQQTDPRASLLSPTGPEGTVGTFLWANLPNGGPDGSSRLCLSCHDGSLAIGMLINPPGSGNDEIPMLGVTGQGKMPSTATGYLGTNFTSEHHTFSLAVNTNLISDKYTQCQTYGVMAVQYPPVGDVVKLYRTANTYEGQPGTNPAGTVNYLGIQCRTCHDPHTSAANTGCFLVPGKSTCTTCPCNGIYNALCDTCHYTDCP